MAMRDDGAARGLGGLVATILSVDINLQIPELQNATPLMIAFQNGRTAVTESLVGRGARVDIADSTGISPILMVCNK
jgi:ankyrin repeat protein